jgi:formate-dependent nitrite reductase cytochrome c552 subunit
MSSGSKTSKVLAGLAALFLAVASAFVLDLWGHTAQSPLIPLVATNFISTATVRVSAGELIASGGDASGLDCYACHEKNKPLKLTFDAESNVILAKEHDDIVMGHGRHKRNNNCFNCHDETNLEFLQTRDGHQVKLVDSPALCGSCHGPTYRDWEAGVHGRTSGFWKRDLGAMDRKVCTSCHDPHSPAFPAREPAPGPHLLHPIAKASPERIH